MKKLIIIARLNEYASRDENRNIPWSPAEIARDAAECREAGAAGVHFHARNPSDGSPDHRTEVYADAIGRIRELTDVLIEPPLGYLGQQPTTARADQVVELASNPKTRPDVASIDMASVNIAIYDSEKKAFAPDNLIFTNSVGELQRFTNKVRDAGLKTLHVCWNVGSLRTAEAFIDMGLITPPAWLSFRLCDGGLLTGHPGTTTGLRAHLDFLPRNAPVEWMAVCSPGSLVPVAPMVIAEGGHLSMGLGDHPYSELRQPTNAEVVRYFVKMARAAGREVASPTEAREILGMV